MRVMTTALAVFGSGLTADLAPIVVPGVLALLGALLGSRGARKSARELDMRWRREESLRMLRWAGGLAGSSDPSISATGQAVLLELIDSRLLPEIDRPFAEAIAAAVQARLDNVGLGSGEYDGVEIASSEEG
jgi:hypothetical protein